MPDVHKILTQFGDRLNGWFRSFGSVEDNPSSPKETVEFIGGPFDGLERRVEASAVYQLPPAIDLPVDPSLFDLSGESLPRTFSKPCTLALYDLDQDGPPWNYRFGGYVLVQRS